MRILITGAPQSGKTTLADLLGKVLGVEVLHTDELVDREWSAASEEVSHWLDKSPDWIIEGVTVPRAIRKWQARNPETLPPFDWFIILPNPRGSYDQVGQATMAKQVVGLASTQKEWIGERWIQL